MTVSNTNRKNTFIGDGTANPLNCSFLAFSQADLVVYRVVIATGVPTLLTLGVNYTVTIPTPLPNTPTITPLASIPATEKWVVARTQPLTQGVDLLSGGSHPSESQEAGLDRQVLMSQDLDHFRRRSMHVELSDDDVDMKIPRLASRINKLAGYDGAGAPSAVDPATVVPGSVLFTAIGQQIAEAADAAAVRTLISAVFNGSGASRLQAGTFAGRPAAATFGTGIYFATDTRELFYSDAAVWTAVSLERVLASALSTGNNRAQITTDTRQLYLGNGSVARLIRSTPRGFKRGLELTWISNTSVRFEVGIARNTLPAGNVDQLDILHTTVLTKLTSALWAEGNNAGGMAQAAAAGTWVNAFVLSKLDGTQTDCGFDTAIDASNLLGLAAVVSAGYVRARRVGKIRFRDAITQILPFFQPIGTNEFLWDNLSGEADAGLCVNVSQNWQAGVLVTLNHAPSQIRTKLTINVHRTGSNIRLNFMSPDVAGATPIDTAWPLNAMFVGANPHSIRTVVWTNTAQQIRIRSDVSTASTVRVAIIGWEDPMN